ncbi:MAG: SET domain-containing protein-lysine N-methyltransferase [Chloracidobacterium sp.]|uniref:SET domain-containing protein-lysine N-methyltransferase n=1 Tax=Chloracidobacterium validum TaxID=2821543 RepID=A0ABX8BCD9_9BACT|nr:SET domain-containing protein-lysine N-methyltransferase [Chloracidobacterium validum]QUW04503.1 SET domain-containing protein-lysine N-methyltransferase [Chloracidobacterium validum]
MQRHHLCEVRRSVIHGWGVFALTRIPARARIIEYKGERISREEADRRYARKLAQTTHTFLFTIDEHTLLDGGRFGNLARYINHACEPNCESVQEADGRIFIEAITDIQPGAELTMDYHLQVADGDLETWRRDYPCRCGSPRCRGTLVSATTLSAAALERP